jgi:hypothetical protein
MKTDIKNQLKATSRAIDLIKISQRTQHTSVKEALTKMLRCISMLAGTDEEDLLEKAQKIADAKRDKDESWK